MKFIPMPLTAFYKDFYNELLILVTQIGEAYAVLSDSQKRQRYDSGQDLEDASFGGGL